MAAQNVLAAAVRGESASIVAALRPALVQTVPWIPASLAVVYLASRFPLGRGQWLRHGLIHSIAALVVAFGVNVLIVLGFWLQSGFVDVTTLFRQAGFWTALRLHVALLVYLAIAALTQGAVYYRSARERELHLARVETQLARARLQALNAQIRPHFLFNTMHTIGQLWRSGRSDDADAVLDHLGSLFHRVQSSTGSVEVPLEEELELVREYLAIEEVRFGDRMRVTVGTAPAALGCLVPPLILQPLVENAVRHGISALSSAGRVEVHAAVEDGRLVLTVSDDGPGFQAAPATAGSGTGLRNTRERLTEHYGDSAVLTFESGDGTGTTVRIELPARPIAPESESGRG
jgi:signal transduction histidine kinase